ncbi:hypothetical protein C7C46_01150 [Streptomyces tateyamensis]|uniref:Uncharacterized protein n=1 Tax=Streptomyces tateyamensis TaxID=565073 RepID=A0A2V4PB81_9ACTN|nr:hypothetical protein [Streptomyces tateyamensis]PYC88283.1 hypothetical protein C7C46_01150 [Streptomyces tateyamensis]
MIGFEVEISLPVTDGQRQVLAGDVLLAKSKTVHGYGQGDIPIYTLVSDKRQLPSKAVYSNLEFVTMPWYAVGDARPNGPLFLQNTLAQIRRVRDALYLAGEAPLATAASDLLTYSPVGRAALLAPQNGYLEEAGTLGCGDGLFTHYSVGSPLGGLPGFLDQLRQAPPPANATYLADARHRLVQARTFAAEVLGGFVQPGATATQARERRELDGYLQLAFTQIVAFADYVARKQDAGQIKNGTVVLCRSALSDVFALLAPSAQAYLRQDVQRLISVLAGYQEQSRTGQRLQFQDRSFREVAAGAPVGLEEYALATFGGRQRIAQERVFGGMREVDPHPEQGASMVPFEIRVLGARLKSWADVSSNLTDLCTWAQTAYEAGRP